MALNASNAVGTICVFTIAQTGTVKLTIKIGTDGSVTGTGQVSETGTPTQVQNCGAPLGNPQMDGCCSPDPEVHGTTAAMTFSGSHGGGAGTNWTYDFSGALNGSEITGTFSLTVTQPTSPTSNGTFPVTLRREN